MNAEEQHPEQGDERKDDVEPNKDRIDGSADNYADDCTAHYADGTINGGFSQFPSPTPQPGDACPRPPLELDQEQTAPEAERVLEEGVAGVYDSGAKGQELNHQERDEAHEKYHGMPRRLMIGSLVLGSVLVAGAILRGCSDESDVPVAPVRQHVTLVDRPYTFEGVQRYLVDHPEEHEWVTEDGLARLREERTYLPSSLATEVMFSAENMIRERRAQGDSRFARERDGLLDACVENLSGKERFSLAGRVASLLAHDGWTAVSDEVSSFVGGGQSSAQEPYIPLSGEQQRQLYRALLERVGGLGRSQYQSQYRSQYPSQYSSQEYGEHK